MQWIHKNPTGNKYLVAKLNSTNFDVCLVFCFKFYLFVFSCTVSSLCTAFSLGVASWGWATPQLSWADFSFCWFLWLLSRPPEWQAQFWPTGLSCLAACGIFQTRGQIHVLHWAGGFLTTGPLGNSVCCVLVCFVFKERWLFKAAFNFILPTTAHNIEAPAPGDHHQLKLNV